MGGNQPAIDIEARTLRQSDPGIISRVTQSYATVYTAIFVF